MITFLPHSRISFLFEKKILFSLIHLLEYWRKKQWLQTTNSVKKQTHACLHNVVLYGKQVTFTPLNFAKTRSLGWWRSVSSCV